MTRNNLMAAALSAATLWVGAAGATHAGTVTLTMDEAPNQPINGLSVTKSGETFTFSDPGGMLDYHSFGPGSITYVQDPSIQGPNEAFSVEFSKPVTSIQFGLSESTERPLTGATVLLSNGTSITFDLPLVDPFAEGQFSWSGSPVTSFMLTPADGQLAIAFDNLQVTVGAPEPSTWAMLILGVAMIGFAARRRNAGVALAA